jgi:xylulokinase
MAVLLGIDLGTGGARAIAVDPASGRLRAAASAEIPLHTPRPLWAEQDPADWWRAVTGAVRGVVAELGGAEVIGIGLSGQMHGVALFDGDGEVLGPALLWCDGRSGEECDEITRRAGGEARLLALTGNPALAGFSAPKLLWLRRHRPELFRRARSFLLPKDTIRFWLTGERASEVSDASGTLLFDVAGRRWSAELLELLEIDPSLLPVVAESQEVTGQVSAAAAAELGLSPGIPVVGGGGDQAAGAVGAGIVRPGLVSATIGSSGVVFAHAEAPARDARVHSFCHAVPGAWHLMGVTQAAGLSLRWLRERIAPEASYEQLAAEAAAVPAGSDGLVFTPYLMGERTPILDPHARGTWFGLTFSHGRGHLVRSIMEGVAFSLRDCLDLMVDLGVEASEVRAAGGGARSQLWRQILADVLERPVSKLAVDEGPAWGAALLAGVGTGVWSSVEEACSACVATADRLEPTASYRERHAVYRELHQRVAPLYRRVE